MRKELISLIVMLIGAGVMGFGLGGMFPKDEPIAVIIAVIGAILTIVGEKFFLRNQKR